MDRISGGARIWELADGFPPDPFARFDEANASSERKAAIAATLARGFWRVRSDLLDLLEILAGAFTASPLLYRRDRALVGQRSIGFVGPVPRDAFRKIMAAPSRFAATDGQKYFRFLGPALERLDERLVPPNHFSSAAKSSRAGIVPGVFCVGCVARIGHQSTPVHHYGQEVVRNHDALLSFAGGGHFDGTKNSPPWHQAFPRVAVRIWCCSADGERRNASHPGVMAGIIVGPLANGMGLTTYLCSAFRMG